MSEQYVIGKAGQPIGQSTTPVMSVVPTPLQQPQSNTRLEVLPPETGLSRFMPLLNIEQAIQRRELIVAATQRLMKVDVDFGKIGGTQRETLLQPGADKLCNLFGLVIQYEILQSVEDWTGAGHSGEPFFYYHVRGRAFRDGFLMGEGIGSCSSWETKYRWRKMERTCPSCGQPNIRKSKNDGGWYCWQRTGGCGEQFKAGDQTIEGQEVGRKPNPDVTDVVNTILKMAYKRAKISTTINATSASEFFTQDVEDFAPEQPRDEEVPPINTGGHPEGTQAAADFVAQRKVADLQMARGARAECPRNEDTPPPPQRTRTATAPPPAKPPATASASGSASNKPWRTFGEMRRLFDVVREQLGEVDYLNELERSGVKKPDDFRKTEHAEACYYRLLSLAASRKAVA